MAERAERRLEEDALERPVAGGGALEIADLPGLLEHRGEASGGGELVGGGEAIDGACLGDELCRQLDPHAWQAADEGCVRVALGGRLQVSIEGGEAVLGRCDLGGELAYQVGSDALGGDGRCLALRGVKCGVSERFNVLARQSAALGDVVGRRREPVGDQTRRIAASDGRYATATHPTRIDETSIASRDSAGNRLFPARSRRIWSIY